MKAIGIDIGTTGICGVVVDTESGRVLRSVTENSEAFLVGCAEWERIQSVERIMAVADGILEALFDPEVAAIGVTGQMHGILYINAGGEAVSPLYTWQDGRGDQPYRGTTYAKLLGSFSGYGNVTDFYNRENGLRPDAAVSHCTVHDYFVMRLCGLKRPLIHESNAASLGLYDMQSGRFDYEVNADAVRGYRVAGEYRGVPVGVAIGDNQASVFSTLADDGDLLVNVGTGSQVSVVTDRPVVAENIETRPYFEGKYLVVGSALCGGRAYSLLKNFYAELLGYVTEVDDGQVYAIMSRMLEGADEPTLAVDTRFAGTRSDPTLRGSISGIGCDNFRPAELTLGLLRGMAAELFGMYSQMGVKRQGIVGSGNGLRKNPALVRVIEPLFGAPVRIPAHLEEAAYGASLFALVCSGHAENAREAQSLIKYER